MSKKRDREASGENLDPVAEPVLSDDAPAAVEPSPTPIEAKLEPKPEVTPKVEEKPADPSDLMPLRVYATIAGPKWDQMAGFVNWARRSNLGPLSMQGWTNEFEKFKNRPVG